MITLGAVSPVFTCKGSICYSSDGAGQLKGTDLVFRTLQATINRFSSGAKFSPVTVDGFIGAGTVAALQSIVAWLNTSLNWKLVAAEITPWVGTKESVAKTSQVLTDRLTTVANALKLPAMGSVGSVSSGGGSSTTVPRPSGGGSLPVPPNIEDLFPSNGQVATDTTTAAGKALPKWPFYLGGAALAIGLGFLIFNRTNNNSTPVSGARWRKRSYY